MTVSRWLEIDGIKMEYTVTAVIGQTFGVRSASVLPTLVGAQRRGA
jgi:hypothetical protein